LEYSPLDTYLITCEKYNIGEKNLLLWSSLSGKEVCGFDFRKGSKEGPKSIKFTKNETFCARIAGKNTIDIYNLSAKDDSCFTKPFIKLVASHELLSKGKKAAEN